MSLHKLPLELRYLIYSFIVFDTPETPSPPPLIQIVKLRDSDGLAHRHCKLHASDSSSREPYKHFAFKMREIDGRMLSGYWSPPYICMQRPKTSEETTLDLSSECGCRGSPAPYGHAGLHNVVSLLLTCRQSAYEIRAWLYPKIIFEFFLNGSEAFGIFTANLLPETKEFVRDIRLTIPIHDHHTICKHMSVPGQWFPDPGSARELLDSRGWKAAIPADIKDRVPKLRALHVNLWHGSWIFNINGEFIEVAAPITDENWRLKELEHVLRFTSLPLQEVTIVVDNVWPLEPLGDVLSGDPKIHERRELADWLRCQLLDASV